MARKKSTTDKARKQAAQQRIRSNNEKVIAKAKALQRAGLIPKETKQLIKAPIKGGAKALSGHARYERARVNKLFDLVGRYIVNEKGDLLPRENRTFPRKVSKEQAKKIEATGREVFRTPKGLFVPTTHDETVTKAGGIIRRRKNVTERYVPIDRRMMGEDADGNDILYKEIKKAFARQRRNKNPALVGFYFQENSDKISNIMQFSSPEKMYDFLSKYGDAVERIGGLVLLTYKQANIKAMETGARIRLDPTERVKIKSKSRSAPRFQTERQKDKKRLMDRIRYAANRAKRKDK